MRSLMTVLINDFIDSTTNEKWPFTYTKLKFGWKWKERENFPQARDQDKKVPK